MPHSTHCPTAHDRLRPRSHASRALVVAVGLTLLAACAKKDDDAKKNATPEAGYVVLTTQVVPLSIELGGRTSAFEVSEVRPQVSGILQERLFTEGTLVRAGQTLFRIDPRLYAAAEAQARANLASAEATREAAEAKAKRYRPLADIEAVSKQDYADALASSRQAAASVAQNKALLDVASINQRFTRVSAPISGRIGRALVTTGALVTANQTDPLASIQRLDPIYVDIPQSSADLLSLRRALARDNVVPSSAEVRLKLEDGSTYGMTGRLEFAEAVVDTNTGAVTLRARFPNPDSVLLPGMYVRAQFSQATMRDAILVPQAGVARDATGSATVMLVGPDDKVVQRPVTTTRTVGDQWLVTAGVAAGDKVIVEGLGRIKVGQVVKPVVSQNGGKPASSAPAAAPAAAPTPASR